MRGHRPLISRLLFQQQSLVYKNLMVPDPNGTSKWETVSGEIPGNAIEFIYTAII